MYIRNTCTYSILWNLIDEDTEVKKTILIVLVCLKSIYPFFHSMHTTQVLAPGCEYGKLRCRIDVGQSSQCRDAGGGEGSPSGL